MASELRQHKQGLNGSAYTASQLEEYFLRIKLPKRYYQSSSSIASSESSVAGQYKELPPTLKTLSLLQKYQLVSIPFETLALHYCATTTPEISLDAQLLFDKLVREKRGGYCMENQLFFMNILRALGFDVYCVGSRVRRRVNGVPRGAYMGWVHAVMIVTIKSLSNGAGSDTGIPRGGPEGEHLFAPGTKQRYMVDVGFGGDGPIRPLPLVHGHIVRNIGEQELRLMHESLPEFNNQSQRVWIYQYRNAQHEDWKPITLFTEEEFLQQDFEVMNYFTSRSSVSYVTYSVFVVRMLLSGEAEKNASAATTTEQVPDGDEPQIYGKIMLAGPSIKKNTGAKTETLQTCKTEQERVQALKDWFGIELSQPQIDGIYARGCSLPREELLQD